jgi:hypothetical protein
MDLAGERGLRQVELGGGFSETQSFRHGYEITQVTQFHNVKGNLATPYGIAKVLLVVWVDSSLLR